ncbi:hypothetical protein [Sandaracinus amylolyticus]|uniref:DUF488 family protein, N3 subclade n=1 Tax=Sandaracinus amylolyticus TaxID=927083 RepID=UPI001F34E9BD|nr:hypothetical protein [Sandaracinus amylolyticus]UJR84494.1 Hypothetical protein I5071_65730 [Sandaracinus amylolyticus]
MLTRYSIVRGARSSSLPRGIRQDTRKHTSHVLRPTKEIVDEVFGSARDEAAWETYAARYRALLEERFAANRKPFDRLASFARWHDVYLGCSCPSTKNPDVMRCHTIVALRFMKERYPDLDVRLPAT